MIWTDCIVSYRSNYHTMITVAPSIRSDPWGSKFNMGCNGETLKKKRLSVFILRHSALIFVCKYTMAGWSVKYKKDIIVNFPLMSRSSKLIYITCMLSMPILFLWFVLDSFYLRDICFSKYHGRPVFEGPSYRIVLEPEEL